MEFAGTILLALVGAQLTLFIYSSIRQARGLERQRQLEGELLSRRIEAANALRQQREQLKLGWNGYRKFVVRQIVEEAERVRSFYLEPHDRKPLPLYKAGQYLTFQVELPEHDKPVVRCYSLSDAPRTEYYRVTIKQALPPPDIPDAPHGLVSTHFHQRVQEGDILDVQAPRGHFTLDPAERKPVVLIAGGVGITPMFCMAKAIAEAGTNRQTHLFYGVHSGADHALKDAIAEIAEQHENLQVRTWYGRPRPEDKRGEDYDFEGHITVDALKELLGSSNYGFYICGPPPMMSALMDGLKKWGVPKQDIVTEAFGAPTVKKAFPKPEGKAGDKSTPAAGAHCKITFGRSGKTCTWDDSCGNILDFAVKNGINIDSGCRAGNCATCLVAIKSGQVAYVTEHGAEPEEGSCLTCITIPEGDLTLDA